MTLRVSMLVPLLFSVTVSVWAQRPPTTTSPTNANAPGNVMQPTAFGRSTGPKPYNEVITSKAKTNKGLLTTHQVEDKYYFEIPDSVLNREILVVNRIAKSAAGSRAGFLGYAGDQIADNVILFEKGPNNRIFLRSISYQEVGRDSSGGMYQSVLNSNLQPIVAAFDIKAFAKDSLTGTGGSVIDVSDYLMGDNEIFFFSSRTKRQLGLGSYQRDNSYIADVKSFPTNLQIRTVKTYIRTPQPSIGQASASTIVIGGASGSPNTYELSSSMIMLPKVPMQPRYFDSRVGYFSTSYTDFDLNPQGIGG